MKRQSKSWWCGIASIANALEVLGIRRSQREIARICHVSPEAGTDETEMKRALLANGVQVDETTFTVAHDACLWLRRHLDDRGPVVLCVDESDHWVTVIGLCFHRFLVFDPARNQGIEVHDVRSIAERWRDSEDGFYGIGVSL